MVEVESLFGILEDDKLNPPYVYHFVILRLARHHGSIINEYLFMLLLLAHCYTLLSHTLLMSLHLLISQSHLGGHILELMFLLQHDWCELCSLWVLSCFWQILSFYLTLEGFSVLLLSVWSCLRSYLHDNRFSIFLSTCWQYECSSHDTHHFNLTAAQLWEKTSSQCTSEMQKNLRHTETNPPQRPLFLVKICSKEIASRFCS